MEEVNKNTETPRIVGKAILAPVGLGKSYTINLHSENDIENCIDFIREYRKLEDMQFIAAKEFIENSFAAEPLHKVRNLFEKWKNKKKDFGEFYFNIDVPYRIRLYNSFGIEDPADEDYLVKIKNNPMAVLFWSHSLTYSRLHNLITFFNNYGITEKPTSFLNLTGIPKFTGKSFDPKDPTFGNTKNWGKYILSLPEEEQKRVVESIIKNYQTENYTK